MSKVIDLQKPKNVNNKKSVKKAILNFLPFEIKMVFFLSSFEIMHSKKRLDCSKFYRIIRADLQYLTMVQAAYKELLA